MKYDKLINISNKVLSEEELDELEEIFYNHLDSLFTNQDFDNDKINGVFQLQNFFPYFYDKDVKDGAWIKIKTDMGYNVYWAKNCNKKMSPELQRRKLNRLKIKDGPNLNLNQLDIQLEKISKKADLITDAQIAEMENIMPTRIKYVKYLRTRTQWEYILPYQYELIYDIQLYVDAVKNKANKKSVNYKMLFTSNDHNQVFYLRSRGISKDEAVMMCKLQQCYFIVNVQELFNNSIQFNSIN